MKVFFRSVMYVVVLVLGVAAGASAQQVHAGKLTGKYDAGKKAFPRYCDGCHGVRGDGNGTLAPYLDPRPRDYTMGIFKCRSTPSGSLPTDEDLYNTLSRGIVTTAMPRWSPLPSETRMDIVAYLKGFSPRFETEAPGIPIALPAEPEVTIQSIKRGAKLYKSLDCANCHGVKGHGDGPAAATLTDVKHRLLPPYDFTLTERFKCGSTNTDLYRTFMTGMDGSPMVSYADKLTPEQAWDLVHYVRVLQVGRKNKENSVLASAGGPKALVTSEP